MTKPQRLIGAHSLGLTGLINGDNLKDLAAAARIAHDTGCNLVELACSPIISGVSGGEIAQALKDGGITNASWCRFFPQAPDGTFPFGDPVGSAGNQQKAFETFDADFEIIGNLRANGITVTDVTGPWAYVLGFHYGRSHHTTLDSVCRFASEMGPRFQKRDLIGSLEYLRWSEDKVLSGIGGLIGVLDRVNHPNVKAHLDTFHMLQHSENPLEVILQADDRIGMFHANGTNRLHPGAFCYLGDMAATDNVNWYIVARALQQVGYAGTVTSEPFCQAIRDAIAALGEGLPRAINPELFFNLTNQHLQQTGVFDLPV